jgi:hypothetical protein
MAPESPDEGEGTSGAKVTCRVGGCAEAESPVEGFFMMERGGVGIDIDRSAIGYWC